MYGGGGDGPSPACAAGAVANATTPTATAVRTARRMWSARFPLDVKEFRTHVDEIDTRGARSDGRAKPRKIEQRQRKQNRDAENDQPHGLGEFLRGGVSVAALHRRVDECVDC